LIHLVPLALGCLIAAFGTWVSMQLAPRLGAVATVKSSRWHQSGDVPRLAGPAMVAAVAPWLEWDQAALLSGVCALGAADDIRPLSPLVKAAGLLVAAAAAVWVTGAWWTGPALWLVANAYNLLDHADGIAAGAAAGAFLGLGGDPGLAAAGACLGFLVFNFPPARTFMGDSGSLSLGAIAVVIGAEQGDPAGTAIWCAIPLADAVIVTLRRLARGQKPWIGGTDHSGHALLRRGLAPRLLPPLYFVAVLAVGIFLEFCR
jgi:UDP-GlcNAc:undecaprenyl-phosphate GlcNAc-1-phosphate transferase